MHEVFRGIQRSAHRSQGSIDHPEVTSGGVERACKRAENFSPDLRHRHPLDLHPVQVATMEAPVMGAEDFSYYGEKVPACFFALGLCPDGMDMPNVHESTFDFNDQAIPLGVETMVRLALEPLV